LNLASELTENINERRRVIVATWSGWEKRGGTLVGEGVGAASWAENRLDVFARGTDNAMHHQWWDGSSWSGWEKRGGTLTGGPAAVSWGPNRIDTFAIGTDKALYHQWWG
jgi:Repeat of unknown function (DUF346)